MPRKQRFKPSRKAKLADGTAPLAPITQTHQQQHVAPVQQHQTPPMDPPIRPVRGRDAVIDD
jgi:hypothetical protein